MDNTDEDVTAPWRRKGRQKLKVVEDEDGSIVNASEIIDATTNFKSI